MPSMKRPTQIEAFSALYSIAATDGRGEVLFGDNFLSADAANTYLDYIAQLFAGDITAEQFAQGLAADLQGN